MEDLLDKNPTIDFDIKGLSDEDPVADLEIDLWGEDPTVLTFNHASDEEWIGP